MNNVWYAVTSKSILIFYRRAEDKPEAMDMAYNLARSMKKTAVVRRVRSRPYFNRSGQVVPHLV
ncbi:MAG: hypothetical protein VW338_08600 [Rhodospirillaceae bacterium]